MYIYNKVYTQFHTHYLFLILILAIITEAKWLDQGHNARQRQNQDTNLGFVSPSPVFLPHLIFVSPSYIRIGHWISCSPWIWIFPCTTAQVEGEYAFSRPCQLHPENLWEALKRLFSTWAVQMGQGQVSDLCNDLWSRHLVLFGELKFHKVFIFHAPSPIRSLTALYSPDSGHRWTS